MTQNTSYSHQLPQQVFETIQRRGTRRCRCVFAVRLILLFILLLSILALVLDLTIFKVKEPRTQFISASVEGITPLLSVPVVRIELNITFNLQTLVENPNHVSFKHGPGKSLLLYNGKQVGEADLYPVLIPAMGSTELPCQLTVQVDELASQMALLIRDVLAGEVTMETITRIHGRFTFLGIFRKHIVMVSECQMAIGVPYTNVRRQDCKHNTKL